MGMLMNGLSHTLGRWQGEWGGKAVEEVVRLGVEEPERDTDEITE